MTIIIKIFGKLSNIDFVINLVIFAFLFSHCLILLLLTAKTIFPDKDVIRIMCKAEYCPVYKGKAEEIPMSING